MGFEQWTPSRSDLVALRNAERLLDTDQTEDARGPAPPDDADPDIVVDDELQPEDMDMMLAALNAPHARTATTGNHLLQPFRNLSVCLNLCCRMLHPSLLLRLLFKSRSRFMLSPSCHVLLLLLTRTERTWQTSSSCRERRCT